LNLILKNIRCQKYLVNIIKILTQYNSFIGTRDINKLNKKRKKLNESDF